MMLKEGNVQYPIQTRVMYVLYGLELCPAICCWGIISLLLPTFPTAQLVRKFRLNKDLINIG